MKLYQSTVLKNLSLFKTSLTHNELMRDHESMYFVWKTIEYFCPRNVLEIGFYKGQTLGLIKEIAGPTTKIVSVDKDYQYLEDFNRLFPNNGIEFIETNSRRLNLDLPFDFIIIDGDHSYHGALSDIQKCLPLLHKNSILCIDDYKFFDGVAQAVKECLLGQNGFIPFMCTQQQMFFHHVSHLADDFLDQHLTNGAKDFIEFVNIDVQGFTVLQGQIYNQAIANDSKIFHSVLKYYNL